jgi:hypothetical protein
LISSNNWKIDKCQYCGQIKPKIKRVAANMTKINVYFKSENEAKLGYKGIQDLGFGKSNVYLNFSKKNKNEEIQKISTSRGKNDKTSSLEN